MSYLIIGLRYAYIHAENSNPIPSVQTGMSDTGHEVIGVHGNSSDIEIEGNLRPHTNEVSY